MRTRAVPAGSSYRLFGQEPVRHRGDHDLTPNTIIGCRGASTVHRPGISLFDRAKVLINYQRNSLGARNDMRAACSIEHKLGIHASPTCVLAFGEKDGAVGNRVGEPGRNSTPCSS